MKIAIGIIAILLSFAIGFQSCAVGVGSSLANDSKTSEAASAGVFVALLYIIGGAFAFAKPKVSMITFIIASVLAFMAAASGGVFKDMTIWGIVSVIFAVMSWYALREAQRDQVNPIPSQVNRTTAQPKQASAIQTGRYCSKCGSKDDSADSAFCVKCGNKFA